MTAKKTTTAKKPAAKETTASATNAEIVTQFDDKDNTPEVPFQVAPGKPLSPDMNDVIVV